MQSQSAKLQHTVLRHYLHVLITSVIRNIKFDLELLIMMRSHCTDLATLHLTGMYKVHIQVPHCIKSLNILGHKTKGRTGRHRQLLH